MYPLCSRLGWSVRQWSRGNFECVHKTGRSAYQTLYSSTLLGAHRSMSDGSLPGLPGFHSLWEERESHHSFAPNAFVLFSSHTNLNYNYSNVYVRRSEQTKKGRCIPCFLLIIISRCTFSGCTSITETGVSSELIRVLVP